ncbi:copper transporter 6-like [Ricinus communis]|uniref:copper transporter 6-like n=1 Tax=Ricinus communis TaxID=3988 RepID=UPI00201AA61C|nr:copper transporter 6-like [Ricinus communis]
MSHDQDMPTGHGSSMYGDDNMNMSSPSMDMMMHMSFYWGKHAIVLFSGWPKESLGMYLLALFFVFFLAVGIEVLSVPATANVFGSNPMMGAFIQASVYAVKMGFAYMVMLSVMSFNLGIFIAAVAGHALGFLIVKARPLALANRPDVSGKAPVPKV